MAVVDERQLLAVGRELRTCTVDAVGRVKQRLLLYHCGVREVEVVLTSDGRTVDIEMSVAFACIDQTAVVGSPCYVAFGFRGGRNLLGGAVFDRSDKHIATVLKSHLLTVGRHHGLRRTVDAALHHRLVLVESYVYFHLLRLCRCRLLCVNLSIVGECESAVGSLRKEAHRMGAKVSDFGQFRRRVNRCGIYIHRAALAFA